MIFKRFKEINYIKEGLDFRKEASCQLCHPSVPVIDSVFNAVKTYELIYIIKDKELLIYSKSQIFF